MYTYTTVTDNVNQTLFNIIDHLRTFDIILLSSSFTGNTLTLTVSSQIEQDQADHLELTAV